MTVTATTTPPLTGTAAIKVDGPATHLGLSAPAIVPIGTPFEGRAVRNANRDI
jgi:hypothetical protein